MNFVVIEDSLSYQSFLKKILLQFSTKVATYASPFAFLNEKHDFQNNAVFFIDIDLKSQQNGIDLAKIIRANNPNHYIIFFTNSAEYSMAAINNQVVPFAYLLKSMHHNSLQRAVEETVQKIQHAEAVRKSTLKIIKCQSAYGLIVIPQKNILYLKTMKKTKDILIKTVDSMMTTSTNLKELRRQLSDDAFTKEFKSIIINLESVRELNTKDFSVEFVTGEILILSERLIYKLRKKVIQTNEIKM